MDKEALAKAAGAALASGALGRTSLPILLFSCCTFFVLFVNGIAEDGCLGLYIAQARNFL